LQEILVGLALHLNQVWRFNDLLDGSEVFSLQHDVILMEFTPDLVLGPVFRFFGSGIAIPSVGGHERRKTGI